MKPDPTNPFYYLLIVASVLFVMTALACSVLPWDNQPEWLKAHGWKLLLAEVGVIIVFGLLSMGLDRFRSLRKPPP